MNGIVMMTGVVNEIDMSGIVMRSGFVNAMMMSGIVNVMMMSGIAALHFCTFFSIHSRGKTQS